MHIAAIESTRRLLLFFFRFLARSLSPSPSPSRTLSPPLSPPSAARSPSLSLCCSSCSSCVRSSYDLFCGRWIGRHTGSTGATLFPFSVARHWTGRALSDIFIAIISHRRNRLPRSALLFSSSSSSSSFSSFSSSSSSSSSKLLFSLPSLVVSCLFPLSFLFRIFIFHLAGPVVEPLHLEGRSVPIQRPISSHDTQTHTTKRNHQEQKNRRIVKWISIVSPVDSASSYPAAHYQAQKFPIKSRTAQQNSIKTQQIQIWLRKITLTRPRKEQIRETQKSEQKPSKFIPERQEGGLRRGKKQRVVIGVERCVELREADAPASGRRRPTKMADSPGNYRTSPSGHDP